jgi:hypothetical protein
MMNTIRVETVVESDGVLHITDLPCQKGDRVEAVIVLHRETRELEGGSEDFLARARRLDQLGQTDVALDIIYSQIDEMLLARKFSLVDDCIENSQTDLYSVDLLLALLTITLAAKTHLPNRAAFYGRVEAALRDRGELEDGLLIGLE